MSSASVTKAPHEVDISGIEQVERDAWLDMYAAAPADLAKQLGIMGRAVDDGALLLCRVLDDLQFNRLAGLGVSTPARGETVDAAIAEFDAAGVRNWVVHVAEGAGRLGEICRQRGLVPHARTWAKFVRDVEPAPAPTSLAIREAGASDAAVFGAVGAQAFGMPPVVGGWLAALVGRPRWRCFMALDGATPVAAGSVYLDGDLAWLGVGATLPSHRGRGAQSALLAARIAAAAQSGCRTATTETGVPHPGEAGPSFNNIQRAGFRRAYPRPNLRRP